MASALLEPLWRWQWLLPAAALQADLLAAAAAAAEFEGAGAAVVIGDGVVRSVGETEIQILSMGIDWRKEAMETWTLNKRFDKFWVTQLPTG